DVRLPRSARPPFVAWACSGSWCAHSLGKEPLGAADGFRVVEMAGLAPGPYCGMILADFGADVVRVDRVGAPTLDLLARGKRSIALNMKDPKGVATLLKLVDRADVL